MSAIYDDEYYKDKFFEDEETDVEEFSKEELLEISISELLEYCSYYNLPLLNKDVEVIKSIFSEFSSYFESKNEEKNE